MSLLKTRDELLQHKQEAVTSLSDYLDELINSDNPRFNSKSDKLSYWITDWMNFLRFEPQFSPQSLRRYKRGEIIKVHLGFNIGSEEGGLHYAVVIDKENAKSSPVVTIVPLTSVKPNTDVTNLKSGSIFLGNELFTSLNAKISATKKHLANELDTLQEISKHISDNISEEEKSDLISRIDSCSADMALTNKMRNEVQRMKIGSIALVNQITTISKIRIYDPKTDHDILSNIKLSNEKLDLIDLEIRKKYTNF